MQSRPLISRRTEAAQAALVLDTLGVRVRRGKPRAFAKLTAWRVLPVPLGRNEGDVVGSGSIRYVVACGRGSRMIEM